MKDSTPDKAPLKDNDDLTDEAFELWLDAWWEKNIKPEIERKDFRIVEGPAW